MQRIFNTLKDTFLPAVLNSYSIVFFFNNRVLALIMIFVSFFNLFAGLSGLISVVFALTIAFRMGYDKTLLKQGYYSFNALLTGIALGTFFEPGLVFFVILILSSLFSLMVSVVLGAWLGKYKLPFLSIPFVLSTWLILLPSGQFLNLGLTQRNIYWMNELYAIGGKPLLDFFQTINNLPLNKLVVTYLKSISSIIFQDNIIAGILISATLLFCSRISFLLSITGFLAAWLFASFIGTDMASFSFYNIGANYILVAIAIGGFYLIPSRYSILWTILLIPLTSLILLFIRKLLLKLALPVFSLPFSVVTIMFIYFLILRTKHTRLVLTPVQHFSPEINLYTYINNADRLSKSSYFALKLPFWGEWTVNQGYDGRYTHKGEWGKALDMVLTDATSATHGIQADQCDNYYCYNKPVQASANGYVADLTDNVEDNIPGKVNTSQNWGNTIVIKHLDNLFTQMSHFRPGSFKVKPGDFVKQGDVVALCGNSGRSPESHLHFQVQVTPVPGAKTIEYPFSYYFKKDEGKKILKSYSIPEEGDIISNVSTDPLLKSAFDLEPGTILRFSYKTGHSTDKIARWEVYTDMYNCKYLFCSETQSVAYFINDGTMFYFTAFYGDRNSLLYFFYLTAYKVLLGYHPDIEITDHFPVHLLSRNKIALWPHDVIAPFYQYRKNRYINKQVWCDNPVHPASIHLSATIDICSFKKVKKEGTGTIVLADNKIKEFTFESYKTSAWAQSSDILL